MKATEVLKRQESYKKEIKEIFENARKEEGMQTAESELIRYWQVDSNQGRKMLNRFHEVLEYADGLAAKDIEFSIKYIERHEGDPSGKPSKVLVIGDIKREK